MITLGPSQAKWQADNAEHLRYEYPIMADDTVLDIGSYRNEFGDEIKRLYGCKVIAFDPLNGNAAWIFDGEIEMGGQYLYTSYFDEAGKFKCKCVDISRYVDLEIALCKINCEGSEYRILNHLIDTGKISLIKNLQVQFHLIDGIDCEHLYDTLAARLALTHKITWQYKFCWENWERL